MTVTEMVTELEVKQLCISDFVHSEVSMDSDIVMKAKMDEGLFGVAEECLKKTSLYFHENNPEE